MERVKKVIDSGIGRVLERLPWIDSAKRKILGARNDSKGMKKVYREVLPEFDEKIEAHYGEQKSKLERRLDSVKTRMNAVQDRIFVLNRDAGNNDLADQLKVANRMFQRQVDDLDRQISAVDRRLTFIDEQKKIRHERKDSLLIRQIEFIDKNMFQLKDRRVRAEQAIDNFAENISELQQKQIDFKLQVKNLASYALHYPEISDAKLRKLGEVIRGNIMSIDGAIGKSISRIKELKEFARGLAEHERKLFERRTSLTRLHLGESEFDRPEIDRDQTNTLDRKSFEADEPISGSQDRIRRVERIGAVFNKLKGSRTIEEFIEFMGEVDTGYFFQLEGATSPIPRDKLIESISNCVESDKSFKEEILNIDGLTDKINALLTKHREGKEKNSRSPFREDVYKPLQYERDPFLRDKRFTLQYLSDKWQYLSEEHLDTEGKSMSLTKLNWDKLNINMSDYYTKDNSPLKISLLDFKSLIAPLYGYGTFELDKDFILFGNELKKEIK